MRQITLRLRVHLTGDHIEEILRYLIVNNETDIEAVDYMRAITDLDPIEVPEVTPS